MRNETTGSKAGEILQEVVQGTKLQLIGESAKLLERDC